ncbi:HAD superfamily hydrolase [Schizosaccharomyces osmophilus]|uniref:HAD superfamily hydrolase n=1 Tax=Schizosaccharomyces osmophilus TaxID=2545709 RepID=A0AAE9WDS3_9SCHI|nr:HAD superfamily hydrolase [Schizosaccharomyces osmophilus]WBW74516.1 HAD superfamily hydrolase [Schizosaccharomyces osmophilus]
MRKLKLITFDAFGTLLQLAKPVPFTYYETAQKYGISATLEEIKKNSDRAFAELSKTHKNGGLKDVLNPREWWFEVIKRSFPCQIPNTMAEDLWNHYSTKSAYRIHPLFEGFLRRNAQEKGYSIGIISNTDDRIYSVFKSCGFAHLIDVYAFSYDIGCQKPEKGIFEYVRNKTGELTRVIPAPKECLHFGDDVSKDVEAAKNIGWHGEFCDIYTNFPKVIHEIESSFGSGSKD